MGDTMLNYMTVKEAGEKWEIIWKTDKTTS